MINSSIYRNTKPPVVVPALTYKFDTRYCDLCGFYNPANGKTYSTKVVVFWDSALGRRRETTSTAVENAETFACDITSNTIDSPATENSITYGGEVTDCTLPPWDGYVVSGNQYSAESENQRKGSEGHHRWQQRCEWKIVHAPTPTCYLKVWLRKTIVSNTGVGTPSTNTYEYTTYEWTGEGNPCFVDPFKIYSDEANKITTDPAYVLEPVTSALPAFEIKAIVDILKYSYFPDYEPDITDEDNPQPNGFPDPAWVASP